MPLLKGAKARTREGFSDNVRREMEAGKPQKQAVAISYSAANEKKRSEDGIRKGHEELHHHHKKEAEHHLKKAEMHKKKAGMK